MGILQLTKLWRRWLQRLAVVVFTAGIAALSIQSSGLAVFNELGYNIVITPDNAPIIWPKTDANGEPLNYGQPTSLTAAELLAAEVCLTSELCTVQAVNAGAIYYQVKAIAGVGEMVFYYDEYGRLLGTQRKSEIAAGDPSQAITPENLALEPIPEPVDIEQHFGDYSEYAVGSTNASFEVDHAGAANYEMPIYTPPGIGDLQPRLALGYNGQGGNGLLGVGFSISGMSSITRCPQTRAQDGISQVAQAIKYTNDDRFCLDGQRLLLIEGTHGQSGAVYRAEIDNFSRVEIIGHNAHGPLGFEVKTKAAQTFEFGVTDNSRIMLDGHVSGSGNNSKILLWAVESVSDVAGNSIHYDYLSNAAGSTGYRTDKITYGAAGYEATVQFNYDNDRFDSRSGYLQGFKMQSTHRMSNVTISVAGQTVRAYHFTYDESSPARKSRMRAIQECVSGGECLPPVTFDWSDGPDKFQAMGGLKTQQSSQEDDTAFFNFTDFTNDGQSDIVIGPNGNGRWLLIEGRDGSLSSNKAIAHGWVGSMSDNPGRLRAMDITGDGHLDILAGPDGNGNWRAQQRNPSGTALSSLGTVSSGVYGSWKDKGVFMHPTDVNGDGKQDLLIGPDAGGKWHLMRANGASMSPISNYISSGFTTDPWHLQVSGSNPLGPDHTRLFDVNGDGLDDILLGPGQDGAWDLLKNTGSGFSKHDNYIPLHGYTTTEQVRYCTSSVEHKGHTMCNGWDYRNETSYHFYTGTDLDRICSIVQDKNGSNTTCRRSYDKHKARNIRPADVNGDGLADLVSGPREDNKWFVWINTGAGFKPPQNWYNGLGGFADNSERVFPLDVNADGMTDFVIGPDSAGTWYYLRSTGNGFVRESNMGSGYGGWHNDEHRIHYTDITGDGLAEFVLSPDSSTWYGFGPNRSNPDKIIGISNGSSPKTTIEYQSLATDADAIYSQNDSDSRRLPMFVVKQVTKGNGLGGNNKSSYRYRDMKLDLDGRGALGFKTVEMSDSSTDSFTRTTYRQDFPFVGMASGIEQRVNDKLISKTTNEYRQFTTAGNSVYVVNSKSIEESYEYDQGAPYKTVTTETGFEGDIRHIDNYGNVEWMRVTTAGGGEIHVKTTTSEYAADDPGPVWKLGRLTRALVEHESPDTASITRESTFDYYPNGQLHREHIEPNALQNQLKKTTEYEYDANGLRNKVTEYGWHADGSAMTPRTASSTITFTLLGDEPVRKTVLANTNGESESSWAGLRHNQVLRHEGPNGKATLSEYDGLGRLIGTTNHLQVKSTTEYRWTNQNPVRSVYRITTRTDGIEDDASVYYDAMNREIRSKKRMFDGRQVIKDTQFNAKGLIERANRPYLTYDTPVWLCFDYDALGRIIGENRPGANGGPECGPHRPSSSVAYDGLTTTSTDLLGRSKRETRNVMNQMVRVDEALDASGNPSADHSWLEYSYDSIQQLTSITDANGQVTRLDYDPNGRKIWMHDPAMGEWRYGYNSFGELELQTDARGHQVRIEYDPLGRMVKRDDDYDGATPVWDWNWTYGTLANGGKIGKLLSVTGPDGYLQNHSYNQDLQIESTSLAQTIDPQGLAQAESLTQEFTYDGYGRVGATTYPGNFVLQNEYNRYGHRVAVKSPAQPPDPAAVAKLQAQKIQLEARGEAARSEATGYLQQAVRFQADAARYESYASLLLSGEAAGANAADAAALYEAAENLRYISRLLIKRSQAKMIEAFASAAQADGLEQQIQTGAASETHNQHRHTALSHADLAVNQINKAKSILREIDGVTTTGAITTMLSNIESYLDQAVTNITGYQHQQALADRYYRLAQSIGTDLDNTTDTVWWRAAEADAEGRVTKSVYGNGLRTDRFYDPTNGHLKEILTGDGVTTLQHLSYSYDDADNVSQRHDAVLGYHEDFSYDRLDRLKLATLTLNDNSLTAGRGWDYDQTGNITAVDNQAYTYNPDPDLAGRLQSTPNLPGSFSYDGNGNITASGGRSYSWTRFNKPASLSQGSISARFSYGADRARISKVNTAGGSVSKTTAYFGAYEKITATASGEVEHKYHISAGGALIAVHSVKVGGDVAAPTQTLSSNYLHKDALGSVSVITDAGGALVDTLAYTPFGLRRDVSALANFTSFTSLLLPSFEPAITKRGYTGHEHIDELDLIHMNGRVYDPGIGRFLSPDPHVQMPKSTQGFNRYAYVQNNPLKYTDPSGYFIKSLSKKLRGFMKKYGRTLVALTIAFYGMPGAAGASAFAPGQAFAAGFASGLVAGGGDFKSALIGGLSAMTANFIGHGNAGNPFFGHPVQTAMAHAVSQGTFTELRGGKFKEGFLGAYVSKVIQAPTSLKGPGKFAFHVMAGGVASALGGGKFKNGATSAAFVYLFNEVVGSQESLRPDEVPDNASACPAGPCFDRETIYPIGKPRWIAHGTVTKIESVPILGEDSGMVSLTGATVNLIARTTGVGTAAAIVADHIKVSESQIGMLQAEIQTYRVSIRRIWPRHKPVFRDLELTVEDRYTGNYRIAPSSWTKE